MFVAKWDDQGTLKRRGEYPFPSREGDRGVGNILSGILVIDKPAGWTAHDVVARVRRLTGERRVGHAGTLDPAALGVLPVCVGEATKVVEYLSGQGKTYLAAVLFGTITDTDDLD